MAESGIFFLKGHELRRAVKLLDLPVSVQEACLIAASLVVERKAKELAPVDMGFLRQTIAALRKTSGSGTQIETAVQAREPYSAYVEIGTGIYGPKARPITPKKGKFLVFQTKDGKTIFAKSVKGRKATPYLAPAAFNTGTEQVEQIGKQIKKWMKKSAE